jgi:hypothetical protein
MNLPWIVDTSDGENFVRVLSSPKRNGKRDIVCVFPMMMPNKRKLAYAKMIVRSVNGKTKANLLTPPKEITIGEAIGEALTPPKPCE